MCQVNILITDPLLIFFPLATVIKKRSFRGLFLVQSGKEAGDSDNEKPFDPNINLYDWFNYILFPLTNNKLIINTLDRCE